MGHQPIASVTITVEIALFRMMPSGLAVLLVRCDNQPHQGERALPGGSVNASDETLDQAILREVCEQTGLVVPAKHLRQVGTYGDIGRDPRGRSVSVLYTLVEMIPDSLR